MNGGESRPNQEALNEQRDRYINQAIEAVLNDKNKKTRILDIPPVGFISLVEDELRSKTNIPTREELESKLSRQDQFDVGKLNAIHDPFEDEYGSSHVREMVYKYFGIAGEDDNALKTAIDSRVGE
ncbi:MAG: hypothetical protein Q8P17_00460 [bacterium]|nr:hypothetical protein [bacterium]